MLGKGVGPSVDCLVKEHEPDAHENDHRRTSTWIQYPASGTKMHERRAWKEGKNDK